MESVDSAPLINIKSARIRKKKSEKNIGNLSTRYSTSKTNWNRSIKNILRQSSNHSNTFRDKRLVIHKLK
jgi:uncharacterized protein (UPF0333 family)